MATFDAAWHDLALPAQRCLELAHVALLAGGLAVGAVVVDGSNLIVAEGRNRAYDPPTGTDHLEATPLAHAEMNAMARLSTATPLGSFTMWSTQQPCSMCSAAATFIGVGQIEAIAADPSNPADYAITTAASLWVVLATTMFMVGRIRRRGNEDPAIAANKALEPEAVGLALRVLRHDRHPLLSGQSLDTALDAVWEHLRAAADHRDSRLQHR